MTQYLTDAEKAQGLEWVRLNLISYLKTGDKRPRRAPRKPRKGKK